MILKLAPPPGKINVLFLILHHIIQSSLYLRHPEYFIHEKHVTPPLAAPAGLCPEIFPNSGDQANFARFCSFQWK